MKLGFAIAVATYRTVFRYGGAALLLGVIPYITVTVATLEGPNLNFMNSYAINIFNGFVASIYASALLHVILLDAPVSFLSVRVWRSGWRMFWLTFFLGLVLIFPFFLIVPFAGYIPYSEVILPVMGVIYMLFLAARFVLVYPYIVAQPCTAMDSIELSWRKTSGRLMMLVIAIVVTLAAATGVGIAMEYTLDYGVTTLDLGQVWAAAGLACIEFLGMTIMVCMSTIIFQELYEPPITVRTSP